MRPLKNLPEPMSIEKILDTEEAIGILYGNNDVLEYYDLEKKTTKKITTTNSPTWAIKAHNKKIYYDNGNNTIKELFTGKKQQKENTP